MTSASGTKPFPVKSDVACPLKWQWSTLFLYHGTTNSCHRTMLSYLPPQDTGKFHNTAEKIEQRKIMLNGNWPERGKGCEYCKDIEDAGGMSDRTTNLWLHETDPSYSRFISPELIKDPRELEVTPTILEVYFTNRCNMSCIYCGPDFSTQWVKENKRFGSLDRHLNKTDTHRAKLQDTVYTERLAAFWQWMEANYQTLKQFHVLGGEPFYQTETEDTIQFWQDHPNPDLELRIFSNLKVPIKKFAAILSSLESLNKSKKCRSVGIIASIDCWGKEAEYLRTGLNLRDWLKNFEYLIHQSWCHVAINATVSALSIKTMPELFTKVNEWNEKRKDTSQISISFNMLQDPACMHAGIFAKGFFDAEFDRMLNMMPTENQWEISNRNYLIGVRKVVDAKEKSDAKISALKAYLSEMDRRRKTNWKEMFPWLVLE